MSTKNGKKLRSQEWWGQPNYESFTRRAWMRSEGFSSDFFQNKPVIGICNSWSEFNNCNAHLRTVAEAVKRGVLAAAAGSQGTGLAGAEVVMVTTFAYSSLLPI